MQSIWMADDHLWHATIQININVKFTENPITHCHHTVSPDYPRTKSLADSVISHIAHLLLVKLFVANFLSFSSPFIQSIGRNS